MSDSDGVERSEAELIAEVLAGRPESFEPLVVRYQPRVFATVRRYARREDEVEDIVQEVFLKAFQKLRTYRGQAPFEHWLMRLTVRTCYDFLRAHQRNRTVTFTDFSDNGQNWLERLSTDAGDSLRDSQVADAVEIVRQVLEHVSPAARLVITLLELEDRSVKEVAALTGWSVPLVKVRAFRARAEMRKCLERLARQKKL